MGWLASRLIYFNFWGDKKRSDELSIDNENISIPTEKPLVKPYIGEQKVFFGRRVIYSSLKPEELTAEKILQILPEVLRLHDMNAKEIDYLYRYYKGEQPILNKTKKVRPDINNITLENHAYEIVEFKKSFGYGEPVQYVQKGEKDSEVINPAISQINKYMESENKSSVDNQIAEWQNICGTAYRWVDQDDEYDEDEAPFEISAPDPRRTFVVYSNGIKEKALFSGFYSWNYFGTDGEKVLGDRTKSRTITIYTDDKMMMFEENAGVHTIQEQSIYIENNNGVYEKQTVNEYPLAIKGNRIIEYPLNSSRIGLIELTMTQLNAINRIKSADLDGIEQFVQSLLVFVNQDIDVNEVKKLQEAGAIKVTSSDPSKPADVKLLTQQMVHSETKIVTDDIYNNILSIIGMPRSNDKASGGDTGQARFLGEGWNMAYQRARQDDLNFKKSEREFLKVALRICQFFNELTDLKISDIDIKIPRDKSDNLLVKAQSLMNLLQSGIHPEVAFSVVGLFGDPHDVFVKSSDYQGEDYWKNMNEQQTIETIDVDGKDNKNADNKNNPADGVNNQPNQNVDGTVKNGSSRKE